MTRPPGDPNYSDDDPTVYTNYGNGGGYGEPPPEDIPWYRKPAALVAFGAIGALLVAVIVYLLVQLLTGTDEPTDSTRLTPLTPTRTVTTVPTTTPTTTSPTTTTTTEPTTTTTTTTTTTSPTTTTTTTTTPTTTVVETQTRTVTETVTVPPPATGPPG